jgi:hypothetical protein
MVIKRIIMASGGDPAHIKTIIMSLKNTKTTLLLLLLMAGMTGGLSSCEKAPLPGDYGSSELKVYLADAPGDYRALWLDVENIMVNVSNDTSGDSGWIDVPLTRKGRYNLLDFGNGRDTLVARANLPGGTLTQIRLILGDHNILVLKDGATIPLKLPSAQQTGIKLNVNAGLSPTTPYSMVLDFDVARSITVEGHSGTYIFKPVIRAYARATVGAVKGAVLPDSAAAYVMAVLGKDTTSVVPDSAGSFIFAGVHGGNYKLVFAADSTTGFKNDTLRNIQVTEGGSTLLDTVWLTTTKGSPLK